MKFTASKLFHSVVITGAALTGCAGTTAKPTTEAGTGPTVDTSNSNASPSATNSPGKCPPGSERPYPPCYWIK